LLDIRGGSQKSQEEMQSLSQLRRLCCVIARRLTLLNVKKMMPLFFPLCVSASLRLCVFPRSLSVRLSRKDAKTRRRKERHQEIKGNYATTPLRSSEWENKPQR
jgi:hypothetical protein